MAAPSYRTAVDERRIAQIRQITHELPASCSDFLRGIAMTTSTFTRLAYALDLRTFFHYLAEERVAFADKPVTQFTDADIERISQKDLEDYAEFLTLYYKHPPTADDSEAIPCKPARLGRCVRFRICACVEISPLPARGEAFLLAARARRRRTKDDWCWYS